VTPPTDAACDGTIERTAEGGVIRFERHLPYAIGDVWTAITEPDQLAQWWLPFDADITVDLREGGELRFAGHGDDAPDFTCTILRVEPPMLLEHTHPGGDSRMRWELEATDAGCTLRLRHVVTDVPGAIDAGYIVGLHTSLSRLEPTLAGQPIPWDWEAFAAAQAGYAELGFAAGVEAS
jgi:uncharacterized protein YndB with AHSA1/START domain